MTYWREHALDLDDPLNREIWMRSPELQLEIDHPRHLQLPGSVGAQQAMVGNAALPWVPDLVGHSVSEGNAVLVIGSAYAGFIGGVSKRSSTIPESDYRENTMAAFQRAFLSHVVVEDSSYYGKIKRMLAAAVPLERVCLLDLCRASFVQRADGTSPHRRDDSGDKIARDRMLFDYKVTNTKFAGPTMFSRGDTLYVNDKGEMLAKQRSTSIRYLAEEAVRIGLFNDDKDPVWTEDSLQTVEEEKFEYAKTILELGHDRRLFVKQGDRLPSRPIGLTVLA